jgi:hypothetical protein
MFETGKAYDFELLDGPVEGGRPVITVYLGRYVQDQNGPLIKISDARGHMIVNTHSGAFFRAIPSKKME